MRLKVKSAVKEVVKHIKCAPLLELGQQFNGVSVGFITQTFARFSGLALAFQHLSLQTRGVLFSVMAQGEELTGMSCSLLTNEFLRVKGVVIATVNTIKHAHVSVALFLNNLNHSKIALALINIIKKQQHLAIGFGNLIHTLTGVSMGWLNATTNLQKGVNIGIINDVKHGTGVCIGLINVVEQPESVIQIGLINVSYATKLYKSFIPGFAIRKAKVEVR
jgi:hypothetical protein